MTEKQTVVWKGLGEGGDCSKGTAGNLGGAMEMFCLMVVVVVI